MPAARILQNNRQSVSIVENDRLELVSDTEIKIGLFGIVFKIAAIDDTGPFEDKERCGGGCLCWVIWGPKGLYKGFGLSYRHT